LLKESAPLMGFELTTEQTKSQKWIIMFLVSTALSQITFLWKPMCDTHCCCTLVL